MFVTLNSNIGDRNTIYFFNDVLVFLAITIITAAYLRNSTDFLDY